MNRTKALAAALQSVALSLWAFPALALAQAQGAGEPVQGPGQTGGRPGWGWLWLVAAIVVAALIWWALSARRRREAPR